MRNLILIASCALFVGGCATQRYGRANAVSEAEKQMLDCREIKLEIAKTEEFLSDIQMQRADTNGMHALGFLGDFGIGNVMEGDAAELSAQKRLKSLRSLETAKACS